MLPQEVLFQLANIERILSQYLNQVSAAFLALPNPEFESNEEEQKRLTEAATNEMENSMNAIRTHIGEEDERFPSVLKNLSVIFDRHLWRAARNDRHKAKAIRYGRRYLIHIERRMASLDHTGGGIFFLFSFKARSDGFSWFFGGSEHPLQRE